MSVIVVSDHGESFGEHGYWEHGGGQHEPQLHVPMILHGMGSLPGGAIARHIRTNEEMETARPSPRAAVLDADTERALLSVGYLGGAAEQPPAVSAPRRPPPDSTGP